MEDLLEKGLFWKGKCSLGPNHPNDEGSFDDEDAQASLIM
jgi:hypothetical protein